MTRFLMLSTLILSIFFVYSFADLEPNSKEWKAIEKKYLNQWNSLNSNDQMTLIMEVIQANNVPAAKIAVSILLDERTAPEVYDFLRLSFPKITNPKALQWLAEEGIVKGNLKKKEKMRLINALTLFDKANEENKKIVENGLLKVVNIGPDEDKVVAVESLGLMKSTAAVPTLIQLLDSRPKNWSLSASIIAAFAQIRARESVEPLINALEHFTGRLQYDAERALEEITYQELGREAKIWRSWWALNKDRPFVRPQHKPMSSNVVKRDPTFYGMPIRAERIIFICDVSLSMADGIRLGDTGQPKYIITGGGKQVPVESETWLDTSKIKTKLDFMKANMTYTLRQLKPEVYFTIIRFHKTPTAWIPDLVPANEHNINAAIAEVNGWTMESLHPKETNPVIDPKMKDKFVIFVNTNIYDAVALAFDLTEKTKANTFYLLSDGVPDCGTYATPGKTKMYYKILELNLGKKVTFNTIGIGPDHDKIFMRAIAEVTGGFYRGY